MRKEACGCSPPAPWEDREAVLQGALLDFPGTNLFPHLEWAVISSTVHTLVPCLCSRLGIHQRVQFLARGRRWSYVLRPTKRCWLRGQDHTYLRRPWTSSPPPPTNSWQLCFESQGREGMVLNWVNIRPNPASFGMSSCLIFLGRWLERKILNMCPVLARG